MKNFWMKLDAKSNEDFRHRLSMVKHLLNVLGYQRKGWLQHTWISSRNPPEFNVDVIILNYKTNTVWAYFRENNVIKLIFNLNYIKDKKWYFITINWFILRIKGSVWINLQNSDLIFVTNIISNLPIISSSKFLVSLHFKIIF